MTNFFFKVSKIFPGTEAQLKIGIQATFNMTVENDDGIIMSANDMKLMKSKEGNLYVESPFRTYEGKDKEGNPKKMKINYVKFFPEQKNWDKQDAIVRLVLDELEKAPASKQTMAKPAVAPARTSAPPAKTSTPKNQPW
jgi:hypothetical protein